MLRRDLIIVVVIAVVIALIAWAVLAGGKSDAPGADPGASRVLPAATASLPHPGLPSA